MAVRTRVGLILNVGPQHVAGSSLPGRSGDLGDHPVGVVGLVRLAAQP